MSLLAAWIAAAAFLGPAARPLRGAHQQPRDAPAVRGSVVLLAADATERSDFVRQQHSWESAPNPQFDYDEDSKWLTEGIEAVRSQNTDVLLPLLSQIRSRPFFRVFAVDLLASCSYTPTHEEPCMLDACEIEPTDEVPPRIVERDEDEYEFELDSWARWDMPSDYTEYYDLEKVPEQNTGYDGSRVWRFIHQKICFQLHLDDPANRWKRDFNRAVAGLHAAVSASIVRDIRASDPAEALVQYRRRLRDEAGAITNLYFAYMLTLCAVHNSRGRLDVCNYIGDGETVQPTMRELTSTPLIACDAVQSAATSIQEHSSSESAAVWKMRLRTRDLLGVMNCVQCNLCRLHGKVMALGLSAALSVILGSSGRGEDCDVGPDPFKLTRTEVGALLTTAAKLSSAVQLVEEMRAMDEAEA